MFTPCASVAVDALSGRLSLWALLEVIQPVGIGQMDAAPADSAAESEGHFLLAPFTVVVLWWREEGDDGREFEQYIALRAPDGREAQLQPMVRFRLERPFHRVLHGTGMCGLRMTGTYQLLLRIRPAGEEQWADSAEYPIIVEDIPEPPETEQPPERAD
jgi:hypothetical protein